MPDTIRTKAALKALFETGDVPVGQDFADMIESLQHVNDTAPSASYSISSSYAPTSITTPYNIGNLSGSSSLNYSNGAFQYAQLTNNIYINDIASGSFSNKLETWLTPSGSNYTLNLNTGSIIVPSDSALGLPKTLTANKTYIVLFKRNNNNWMLASLVGGY